MLTDLSVSGFVAFAAMYPLCFLANPGVTIDRGFYRFNLGLSCFVASLGILALLFAGESLHALGPAGALAGLWLAALLAVTWAGWQRERPRLWLVAAPSLLGAAVGVLVVAQRAQQAAAADLQAAAAGVGGVGLWLHAAPAALSLVGGLALGMALYSMILGHWYLNVTRLPLAYLGRAVAVYAALLLLRAAWNAFALATQQVAYQGFPLPLYGFVPTLDGFFIAVAIFFGTLFPLVLTVLVHRTLRAKSTQAATGILYVVVIAAIIGDFSYRFFQLRYGVVL